MKIFYKKKQLSNLFNEYPLIYIFSSEKKQSKILIDNQIKNIKFKNTLLKSLNINLFNGFIFLIYGNYSILELKNLKNIVGVFSINKKKNYFITFNKFLKLIVYINYFLKYKSFFNIIFGSFFWFLLKLNFNKI